MLFRFLHWLCSSFHPSVPHTANTPGLQPCCASDPEMMPTSTCFLYSLHFSWSHIHKPSGWNSSPSFSPDFSIDLGKGLCEEEHHPTVSSGGWASCFKTGTTLQSPLFVILALVMCLLVGWSEGTFALKAHLVNPDPWPALSHWQSSPSSTQVNGSTYFLRGSLPRRLSRQRWMRDMVLAYQQGEGNRQTLSFSFQFKKWKPF